MIIDYFKINDWIIKLYLNGRKEDLDAILDDLFNIHCRNDCLVELAYDLLEVKNNIGFTFTNAALKRSIIIIGLQDNKLELINTIAHESRHLQQHISNWYNLNENSEDVCYLLGEIVQKVYEICVNHNLL